MSCSNKSKIVFTDPSYADKLETLNVTLSPSNGETLTAPADGYFASLNGVSLATGFTTVDDSIVISILIPSGTFDPAEYRDGIIYPVVTDGTAYFEIEWVVTFKNSESV